MSVFLLYFSVLLLWVLIICMVELLLNVLITNTASDMFKWSSVFEISTAQCLIDRVSGKGLVFEQDARATLQKQH